MYTLTIENHKGEQLQLTQNPNYSITSVEGLPPPTANINTAVNANFDGSTYRSSRLNERNIVIMLAIEGDAEANRINLYQYIKAKKQCTLYYQNGSRNVSIVGYVESLEIAIFGEKESAQISIICPRPYFADVVQTILDMSATSAMFEFPFSIPDEGIEFSTLTVATESIVQNLGDVETGALIVFHATGDVMVPAIYNVDTGERMRINVDMTAGDLLVINTKQGEKSIHLVVDGIETNVINKLIVGSTWLQFESGANTMLVDADMGVEHFQCFVTFNNLYEGV